MDKSFARLLRNSRLSTYDPSLPQIYRTTSAHKKVGDWGLKRNLPAVIRGSVLQIHALDTAEHQTPFKSALHQQHVNQVWLENFPHSLPPLPKPKTQAKDISTMPKWEWKAFLKKAEENREIWKEGLKQGKFGQKDWLSFMNAVKMNEDILYSGSIDDQPEYATKAGLTYSYRQPKGGSGENDFIGPAIALLTGSGKTNAVERNDNGFGPIIVKGRILNSVNGGWAIGIAGIVGSMAFRYSTNFRFFDRENIHDFVVLTAEWDSGGRPNITVKPFFERSTVGMAEAIGWIEKEKELENASLAEIFMATRDGNKMTGLLEANRGVGNNGNPESKMLIDSIQSIIQTSPMTSRTTEKFEKANMEKAMQEMDSIFNKSPTTEKIPPNVEAMFTKILNDRTDRKS